VNFHPQMSHMR